ncbi:MAG: ABC-F family ATP-binding cassette domain-containing protein [Balneolaceae bacterium]|nr:ABC-F family ATP-binding cassette domain-containing protein [Balneolaceae bacterium]
MTILSTDNLSKSFGVNLLFENITFGISEGDKTALVAPNGTGKSTLLKILAGRETADTGKVMVQNGIRVAFLAQEPELDDTKTIREYIASGDFELVQIIQEYERAAEAQAEDFNPMTQKAFEKASAAMEAANAWDYEQRMEQILDILNITDLDQPISTLSGGERKRVALAFVLIDNPDFLILDEPTNHLDLDMIEWLESYLIQAKITLLMVTHDRYFLDRVCDHIIEIDRGKLYHHNGNYQYYLEKRSEREALRQKEMHKAEQLYKKELEWMRRGPKARTSKSKSRIQSFHDVKDKVSNKTDDSELQLEAGMERMGKKILELENISKRYDETVILDDFSYSFKRGERIGIIGKNGVGKSTFLKILTGEVAADSGEVDTGETIVFGHYQQKGIEVDESMRVIDVLKEIASVIELSDGTQISASQFLEHFMFTPEMQYTPVEKLSGGEKRRLGLMMTLIKNPNFLILDEPTNDLDLDTLQVLEDFLLNFSGCLIVVSHDRFFMDKLVDHYFAFEGDGEIRDHHGTYSEYREMKAKEEAKRKRERQAQKSEKSKSNDQNRQSSTTNKLTFAERKEFKRLEKEVASLEEEVELLEEEVNQPEMDYKEREELTARYMQLKDEVDEKTMRWLELAEKEG